MRHARDHDVVPGVVETLAPGLRRITANNPGPFTFKGTGTLIVGEGRVAVIDPGPEDPKHIAALLHALGKEDISHILITHTHRDHSPGCRLLQQQTAAPTYGFGPHGAAAKHDDSRIDSRVLPDDDGGDTEFVPDVTVADGTMISGDGWQLECLHTPGHASNHVCFADSGNKRLFCGDHVMAWSTSVILQPDGHMGDYLANLERLLTRDDQTYWPAHGGPVTKPQSYVAALLEHRRVREREILSALALGYDSVRTLLPVVYPALAPGLTRGALHSLLSTVAHLVDSGKVRTAAALTFDQSLSLVSA